MEQRLGLDVDVEESHRAADLRQPEPNAQEVGLVAHEQRNAVSFPQLHPLEENIGESVAALLDVPVGVRAVIVDDERLVGDAVRLLDEPVQDRTHAGCHLEQLQLHAVPHHLDQKEDVPPKVREAEFLQDVSRENARGQSREPSQRQSHVCGCETASGRGAGDTSGR